MLQNKIKTGKSHEMNVSIVFYTIRLEVDQLTKREDKTGKTPMNCNNPTNNATNNPKQLNTTFVGLVL